MREAAPKGGLNDAIDRQIIDKLQGDFPICERPYAEAEHSASARTNC
jgi:DNA-binding Lrp family transcriptional regulator